MNIDVRTRARLLAGCVLVTMACQISLAQDFPNIASEKRLPEGDGIAARFVGDRDIASHKSVIFAENFEAGDFRARWDEVRDDDNRVLKLISNDSAQSLLGKKSLQVVADLKRNTGGGMTKWFESADAVFFRWYVLFDKDCDYVHHFCTVRANRSLQGGDRWSGFGGAGDRPEGDTRFSTALEPWGDWGKLPPPGKWNFYSYWHQMKPSPDGKFWGNSFLPDGQSNIRRGEWICCEMMVKHNTPNQRDGEQAFWIDGQLRGHWRGINWRTSPTLWANAFTLESYVTDRWTKNPINIVTFDNIVIAKEYIGPAAP